MAERVVTKRRYRDRVFCPHCEDYLPNSTFYRHKETFYNPVSREWRKENDSVESRCRRGIDMGMDVAAAAESSSGDEEEQAEMSLEEPEGEYYNYSPGSTSAIVLCQLY